MRPINPFYALVALPKAVHSICYWPDGAFAADYSPCNPNAVNSTCCGQGFACLSNNICMATSLQIQAAVFGGSKYIRGSCTDRSWTDASCPSFCVTPANRDNLSGYMGIIQCDGVSAGGKDMYFCQDGATDNKSVADNCASRGLVFPGKASLHDVKLMLIE